jgi:hypothetical protein
MFMSKIWLSYVCDLQRGEVLDNRTQINSCSRVYADVEENKMYNVFSKEGCIGRVESALSVDMPDFQGGD